MIVGIKTYQFGSIWSFWRHLRVSSLIVKFSRTLQDALILAKLYIMMYFCTLEQNGVKDVIFDIFSKFLPPTIHLSSKLRNMNWDRLKYFGDILESQTWFESLAYSTRHLPDCNRWFSAIPPINPQKWLKLVAEAIFEINASRWSLSLSRSVSSKSIRGRRVDSRYFWRPSTHSRRSRAIFEPQRASKCHIGRSMDFHQNRVFYVKMLLV